MPTLQQLEQALIAADKAGDTAAATALAGEMRAAMNAQQGPLKTKPFDPTADINPVMLALGGAGQQVRRRIRSLGNMVGLVSDEEMAHQARKEAPLMESTAGKVGAFGADVLATLPVGASIKAGALAGGALGLSDPEARGLGDRLTKTATGAGLGAGGAALGKLGSRMIANRTAEQGVRAANEAERMATLQAGHKLGLVAPPSTTNPTWMNRLTESFAGKEAVEQEIALQNAGKMQDAMRKFLGVRPGTPLTVQTLNDLRAQAGKAYDAAKGIGGVMYTDSQFLGRLNTLEGAAGSASRSFPGLGGTSIREALAPLKQLNFRGDDAVEAVKALREAAKTSFAQRQSSLGRAQIGAAEAMEDLIERNIQRQVGLGQIGKDYGKQVLSDLRSARQMIAKTYAVEKIVNKATGNIQGAKAAAMLGKGAPLTGELRDVAKFASAFNRATQEPTRSAGVNALRMSFGVMGAATGNPETLLLPLGGTAVSKMLANPTVNKALSIPSYKAATKLPRAMQGLGRGLTPAYFDLTGDEDE